MKRFVVYEVWTRSAVVEAESQEAAYVNFEPGPIPGLSLSNWHAVEVTAKQPSSGEPELVRIGPPYE